MYRLSDWPCIEERATLATLASRASIVCQRQPRNLGPKEAYRIGFCISALRSTLPLLG